jgi:EF-P beta-lysylation protein EpmB
MKCNSGKINTWQSELVDAVTQPKELLELLHLDMNLLPAAEKAAALFPLKVPRGFIARMEKGNLKDPLLLQVLPIHAELEDIPGYTSDPLQEAQFNPLPGLLHKYHGRVLMTLASACGINCRYCFRRFFPYEDNNPGSVGWQKALDYIEQDTTISEVILSGGDPFMATDHTINTIKEKLATFTHIKRLRIHSRMPIVLPARITPELIDAITSNKLKTILVVHCNHPQEITPEVKAAMQLLSQAGIALLNQSVLLKDVNDDADILVSLSETLFDAGILPYYLHVLDKVQGAAHFDLSHARGTQLHWEVMQRLSGYLVPKLVCEQPGAPAKLPLKPQELYTE